MFAFSSFGKDEKCKECFHLIAPQPPALTKVFCPETFLVMFYLSLFSRPAVLSYMLYVDFFVEKLVSRKWRKAGRLVIVLEPICKCQVKNRNFTFPLLWIAATLRGGQLQFFGVR